MKNFKKAISILMLVSFVSSLVTAPAGAQVLPIVGSPVGLKAGFQPPVLLGLKIHPENPLLFDFIVDQGQAQFSPDELKSETEKLVKYFLAALTLPDKEVWVNLSPTEKDRIIPDALSQTIMGKTMLEQDYTLKQLASSLTNPETDLGHQYWQKAGAAPTLSKVWIVPEKAEVLESNGIVLVGEKKLKVKMEEGTQGAGVFQSMILPAINKEVNESKDFANVRQIYNSVILATWYKQALKDSLLGKVYADKSKVAGVETDDKAMKQRIYEQYLAAFKKGAYNLIKEETDSTTGEIIPRKYFSGGISSLAPNQLVVRAGSPLEIQTILSASSTVSIASVQATTAVNEMETVRNRAINAAEPATTSSPLTQNSVRVFNVTRERVVYAILTSSAGRENAERAFLRFSQAVDKNLGQKMINAQSLDALKEAMAKEPVVGTILLNSFGSLQGVFGSDFVTLAAIYKTLMYEVYRRLQEIPQGVTLSTAAPNIVDTGMELAARILSFSDLQRAFTEYDQFVDQLVRNQSLFNDVGQLRVLMGQSSLIGGALQASLDRLSKEEPPQNVGKAFQRTVTITLASIQTSASSAIFSLTPAVTEKLNELKTGKLPPGVANFLTEEVIRDILGAIHTSFTYAKWTSKYNEENHVQYDPRPGSSYQLQQARELIAQEMLGMSKEGTFLYFKNGKNYPPYADFLAKLEESGYLRRSLGGVEESLARAESVPLGEAIPVADATTIIRQFKIAKTPVPLSALLTFAKHVGRLQIEDGRQKYSLETLRAAESVLKEQFLAFRNLLDTKEKGTEERAFYQRLVTQMNFALRRLTAIIIVRYNEDGEKELSGNEARLKVALEWANSVGGEELISAEAAELIMQNLDSHHITEVSRSVLMTIIEASSRNPALYQGERLRILQAAQRRLSVIEEEDAAVSVAARAEQQAQARPEARAREQRQQEIDAKFQREIDQADVLTDKADVRIAAKIKAWKSTTELSPEVEKLITKREAVLLLALMKRATGQKDILRYDPRDDIDSYNEADPAKLNLLKARQFIANQVLGMLIGEGGVVEYRLTPQKSATYAEFIEQLQTLYQIVKPDAQIPAAPARASSGLITLAERLDMINKKSAQLGAFVDQKILYFSLEWYLNELITSTTLRQELDAISELRRHASFGFADKELPVNLGRDLFDTKLMLATAGIKANERFKVINEDVPRTLIFLTILRSDEQEYIKALKELRAAVTEKRSVPSGTAQTILKTLVLIDSDGNVPENIRKFVEEFRWDGNIGNVYADEKTAARVNYDQAMDATVTRILARSKVPQELQTIELLRVAVQRIITQVIIESINVKDDAGWTKKVTLPDGSTGFVLKDKGTEDDILMWHYLGPDLKRAFGAMGMTLQKGDVLGLSEAFVNIVDQEVSRLAASSGVRSNLPEVEIFRKAQKVLSNPKTFTFGEFARALSIATESNLSLPYAEAVLNAMIARGDILSSRPKQTTAYAQTDVFVVAPSASSAAASSGVTRRDVLGMAAGAAAGLNFSDSAKAENDNVKSIAEDFESRPAEDGAFAAWKNGDYNLKNASTLRITFPKEQARVKFYVRLLRRKNDAGSERGLSYKSYTVPVDGVIDIPIEDFPQNFLEKFEQISIHSGKKAWAKQLDQDENRHAIPQKIEAVSKSSSSAVGGIDFDPTNMNLQIKRDGKGVPLPLPQQNLEQINIPGLFPVIINIVPVNPQTLPIFLGQAPSEPAKEPPGEGRPELAASAAS